MIALSIKEDQLLYALFSGAGKRIELTNIGILPFISQDVSTVIASLAEEIPVEGEDIFLTLDKNFIQCSLVVIETALEQSEIKHFLNWQMEQKYGTLWPEMKAFYQEVREDGDALTVASCIVRERTLNAIKSAVKKLNSFPVWLEPDSFALSRVLSELDDGHYASVALFEPYGNLFRAIFHDKGQLAAIAEFGISEETLQLEAVTGDSVFVSNFIDEFDQFILGEKQDLDVHMFVTGALPTWASKIIPEPAQVAITHVRPFEDKDNAGNFAGDGSFSSILGLLQLSMNHA